MPNSSVTTLPTTDTSIQEVLNIHSIESFGTYDGPGIRMVVFLQGCPYKCVYCSNPDTMNCEDGKHYAIDQLVEEASHMKGYFKDKGGVTVSGGEPCMQAKQLTKLFSKLKAVDINTCLDTNGHVFNHYVVDLLEVTDLVLLDVKHINDAIHQKITGRSNAQTLKFAEHLERTDHPFWLRYVLVPGLTDHPIHLHELGEYFKSFTQLAKVEIQPYHKLGVHKWEHLGMEYPLKDVPENTSEQLNTAKSIFEQYFKEVVVN